MRGRTGFYGPEHESRINLIRELQADGYKLEAIGRLLDSAGGSSEEVLRFTRALKAPFEDEQPQIVTAEELAERWNAGEAAPALLRKAERLGILRPLPDGNFEELSPRLGRASAELASLGIPAETALDVAAELRKHSSAVAKVFVELFMKQVWKPFEDQGRPETTARGSRRARAPAAPRLRRPAGDVPAGDDRGGRRPDGREVERIQTPLSGYDAACPESSTSCSSPPVVARVTWIRPRGCPLPGRARTFSSCVKTRRSATSATRGGRRGCASRWSRPGRSSRTAARRRAAGAGEWWASVSLAPPMSDRTRSRQSSNPRPAPGTRRRARSRRVLAVLDLPVAFAGMELQLPAPAVLHGLQLLPGQVLRVAVLDAADVDEHDRVEAELAEDAVAAGPRVARASSNVSSRGLGGRSAGFSFTNSMNV